MLHSIFSRIYFYFVDYEDEKYFNIVSALYLNSKYFLKEGPKTKASIDIFLEKLEITRIIRRLLQKKSLNKYK